MRSRSRRSSLGQRGAVTWVTLLLLGTLTTVVYLAVVWVPVAVVHYEVKAVVRDYGNQAVKNLDDATLLERMCHKLRVLDTVQVPNENGVLDSRPAVEVAPQEITWVREPGPPPTLHVAFSYHRDVHYPVLDRWQPMDMDVDMTVDLTRADWGPTR